MEIAHSRALLDNAAMSGKLDGVPTYRDPFFGLTVPTTCPGVPDAILYPRKPGRNPQAYETTAKDLAALSGQFTKYAANVSPRCWRRSPEVIARKSLWAGLNPPLRLNFSFRDAWKLQKSAKLVQGFLVKARAQEPESRYPSFPK